MRRGGVTRGWAGQGDGEPCREVGVEGAIDRVKRLATRRFFSRLGVAGVGIAAMWVPPFHFLSLRVRVCVCVVPSGVCVERTISNLDCMP